MEVGILASHSPPIEIEAINKSPFHHFNTPLPDTLDFLLQEVTITGSVPILSDCIAMLMVSENPSISYLFSTIPSV